MVIWERYTHSALEWDEYVESLSGSFYQTYGWGEVRKVSGWEPLRLIGKSDGQVVAGASVLVTRRYGIAVCWIPGGPMGQIQEISRDFTTALRSELKTKFFYCRISLLRSDLGEERAYLADQGWKRPSVALNSGWSMSYALDADAEMRKTRASGNWRHNLKRSERYGLNIEHWTRPDAQEISKVYREMETLKNLTIQNSESELIAIMNHCADRLIVYQCRNSEGKLLAIRAAGLCGTTAMDLLAAAGGEARKVYATHATLWALLEHCYQLGFKEYDLSGVDFEANKGVFDFKKGTGASVVELIGEWEWGSVIGIRKLVNFAIGKRR